MLLCVINFPTIILFTYGLFEVSPPYSPAQMFWIGWSRRYGEAVQELSICMALAPRHEEELLQPFVERLHLMRLESTWGSVSSPNAPSALVWVEVQLRYKDARRTFPFTRHYSSLGAEYLVQFYHLNLRSSNNARNGSKILGSCRHHHLIQAILEQITDV